MQLNVAKEVAALRRLTMNELRDKYAEVHGESTRAGNRIWLVKRIAWRLQALAEGDLSERARRRAAELANDADFRMLEPRPPQPAPAPVVVPTAAKPAAPKPNGRLMPGTVLTRVYKAETLQVRVLADGFEFEGDRFASLSAVAQAITGAHWNGRLFFDARHLWFQSPHDRGMSSDFSGETESATAPTSFNPLMIGACLQTKSLPIFRIRGRGFNPLMIGACLQTSIFYSDVRGSGTPVSIPS